MTDEQKAAYVYSQAIAALIELKSMEAANYERAREGLSLAYGEDQLYSLIDKYGLGHNAVLSTFQGE